MYDSCMIKQTNISVPSKPNTTCHGSLTERYDAPQYGDQAWVHGFDKYTGKAVQHALPQIF